MKNINDLIKPHIWNTILKVETSDMHPPHLIETRLVTPEGEDFETNMPFVVTEISKEYYEQAETIKQLQKENKELKAKVLALKKFI